jgi:hypothetical protein
MDLRLAGNTSAGIHIVKSAYTGCQHRLANYELTSGATKPTGKEAAIRHLVEWRVM